MGRKIRLLTYKILPMKYNLRCYGKKTDLSDLPCSDIMNTKFSETHKEAGGNKPMRHCGTQRIETDRLILRRFESKDSAAMYNNWASDEEVTKYLTWPAHSSQEVSQKIIEDWIGQYSNENYYHWAIVLKDNADEPIGDIAVVGMKENVSLAHIGYCIGRNWWHKGITSEALRAVMDFLFDEVDELERLRRENIRLKRQLEEKDMLTELLKKVQEFERM